MLEWGRRKRIIDKVVKQTELQDPPPEADVEGKCLVWTGPTSGEGRGGGYPRMKLDGQTVAVHRVMYTNAFGYIPGKKHIDHKCRNRLCVNPAHLEMVTHKENCRRRDKANERVNNAQPGGEGAEATRRHTGGEPPAPGDTGRELRTGVAGAEVAEEVAEECG